jgi:hypothetical protein
MWTEEQRKTQGDLAKARWSDPAYRISQSESIKKTPHCVGCGETDITKFYVDDLGRRTNKSCKECHKINCKRRWHGYSAVKKASTRVKKYGITVDEFMKLCEAHNGKCAICGVEPKTKRGLHIDHCHDTGVIRGLLCNGCNTGIGLLQESPEIMTKAIEYLLRSK